MHDHDRERLFASIAVALLLHALVGATFWVSGLLNVEPYPEYTPPLYVELESSFVPEDPPPPAEPAPEPEEPEELVMEDPGDVAEEPAVEEPADSQPEPQPEPPSQPEPQPQPEPEPAPRPEPAPVVQPRPQPEPTPQPEEPIDLSEELPWLRDSSPDEPATQPPPDDGLFDFSDADDTDSSADLPDWANSVMEDTGISTDGMETQEITQLASRIESDPELEALMQRANRAVERGRVPAETASESTDGESASNQPSTENIADNASLQWVGAPGGRGTGGDLPVLAASDFGNFIPARITFVVVFDVNSQGVVVPGSVIFQRRSGYTQVDRKVRSAVLNWKFLPAPGIDVATGLFTLVVERQDIR